MPEQNYHIVLLQDDHFQVSDFSRMITKALGEVGLEKISCEAEFLDLYESKPTRMPDIFVLDLMVNWQSPWIKTNRIQNLDLPIDRAGVRCLELLRKYDSKVPIIICTVIDTNTLDQTLFDERKNFLRRKDEGDDRLIELIKKLLMTA